VKRKEYVLGRILARVKMDNLFEADGKLEGSVESCSRLCLTLEDGNRY